MDGPGWDEGGCAPLVGTGAARTIKAGTHAWADMAIPYWKSPGLGCQTWGLRQEQDANQRGQDSHAALLDQAGQQRAHGRKSGRRGVQHYPLDAETEQARAKTNAVSEAPQQKEGTNPEA
jgi:hypothetical protein